VLAVVAAQDHDAGAGIDRGALDDGEAAPTRAREGAAEAQARQPGEADDQRHHGGEGAAEAQQEVGIDHRFACPGARGPDCR
jgi:hypothetical protein